MSLDKKISNIDPGLKVGHLGERIKAMLDLMNNARVGVAAQGLGISSLFTTFFGLRDKEIKEILGIPPRVFMECAVYLGYSSETLGRPRRKPIEEVVHADRFGNAYQPVTRLSG